MAKCLILKIESCRTCPYCRIDNSKTWRPIVFATCEYLFSPGDDILDLDTIPPTCYLPDC